MPSEPKKPIEQTLEASAKARRDAFGEDPKMPNPMRARLHEEIARQGREEIGASGQSWIHMFWPRLAVAAVMATILVIGSTMWWRGTHPSSGMMQVAGNAAGSSAEMRNAEIPPEQTFAKGPAAAAATAQGVSLSDNNVARIEPAQTPAADVDSLGQPHEVTSARSRSDAAKESLARTEPAQQTVVAAAPAAAAPMTAAKTRVVGKSSMRGGATTASEEHRRAADATTSAKAPRKFIQLFNSQSFRNNSQSNKVPNFLNTFTVEQQGEDIKVVDSDGSTYTGKVEGGSEAGNYLARDEKRDEAGKSRPKGAATQPSEGRFRASGYNISLQKPVVFEGNYDMQQQKDQQLTNEARAQQNQEPTARIIGTARVNGEPPVQIDATAVTGEQMQKQR